MVHLSTVGLGIYSRSLILILITQSYVISINLIILSKNNLRLPLADDYYLPSLKVFPLDTSDPKILQ